MSSDKRSALAPCRNRSILSQSSDWHGAGITLHHYQACGFAIHSDLPLPMPVAGADGTGTSLAIRQTGAIDQGGDAIGPFATAGDRWINFTVPGLVRFHICRERGIAYQPANSADDASIASFVINSALPCAAMLAGLTTLRGASVATDAGAILLIGPTAAGKSAVAAELARRGMEVLSDHVALVSDDAKTLPGIPTLTLPRDCAHSAGLDIAALQRSRPGLERFHCPQALPEQSYRPVSAIYQLLVHTAQDVEIADIKGAERLSVLRNCAVRSLDLQRFGHNTALLARTAALSAQCRFRRVRRPVKDMSVESYADHILQDLVIAGATE
ncbi:phosphoenolpyruvate carboxykinase (ATP) [Parerythrobacter aestuarii]|uniref:hypothetical protein n=1 Tax=Parerythrobacter aestuarii TaxID=3020909 RepID=UPI0024DE1874|nr:hypothetical protein [Parerythrobacter aestuarii]